MARKLPWSITTSAPVPSGAHATPRAKRPRPSSEDEHDDDLLDEGTRRSRFDPPRSSPRNLASTSSKHRASRTPSASPPPGPPALEEMGEADDGWMMVEDELHATAQGFTRHLHHAEYRRLQRQARQATRKSALEAKAMEGMRAETKRRVQGELVRQRQDEGLKDVGATRAADGKGTAEAEDPWSGTTLAGLMSPNPSQSPHLSLGRPALVGLERIPSSTRAARGYTKGHSDCPEKQRGGRKERTILEEIFAGKNGRDEGGDSDGAVGLETEDEEDLNRPPKRHNPNPTTRTDKFPREDGATADFRAARDTGGPKHEPKSRKSGLKKSKSALELEEFDDGFGGSKTRLEPRPVAKPTSGATLNRRREEERDTKNALHEIPTFLV